MALRFHNTLTGRAEEFVPLTPGKVGMYVCGVTVYDRSHIGHARALVAFDVISRYLRFLGYELSFVRNFTDIDDKIINRANERGISTQELSETCIREFGEDMRALGCLPPTVEPRATQHIPDMIDLIQNLQAKGLAYTVGGDVYYAVDRFATYGKLSHRRLDDMLAGARVEVNERKRHALDFTLWKASKPGEPAWDSPWGKGRPGWHIECSAMSSRYLGQPFDIHGGGADLIFPHHENEIAQSEGAQDRPFARYWLHNGMVTVEGEKMSKSLGNALTIGQVLESHTAETLRVVLLSTQYRMPLNFSARKMDDAAKSLGRAYQTLARIGQALGPATEREQPPHRPADRPPDSPTLSSFQDAMNDDCNTPRALGAVFETVREANRRLDAGQLDTLAHLRHELTTIGGVLGILQEPPEQFLQRAHGFATPSLSRQMIEQLIADRAAARTVKDFKKADAIRAQLHAHGVMLKDSPSGTSWTVDPGRSSLP